MKKLITATLLLLFFSAFAIVNAQPVVTSPTNFTTGVDYNATLTINFTDGINTALSTYEVVFTAATGTSQLAIGTPGDVTVSTLTFTGVPTVGPYSVDIPALTLADNTVYSFTIENEIDGGGLSTPIIISTGTALTAGITTPPSSPTSLNPDVSWTDATGGFPPYVYDVYINDNAGSVHAGDVESSTGETSPFTTTLANTYNEDYYVIIAVTDETTTTDYSEVSFTTYHETPVLTSPVDVAKDVNINYNVNFTWVASAGATDYRIQISTSSGFGTTEVDELTGSVTPLISLDLSALDYYTTYYWRVRADDGNTSEYSSAFSFRTIDNYTASTPFPTDGATDIVNSSIQFIWQLLGRTEFATFQSPTFKLIYDTDAAFTTAPVVLTSGFISTVSTGMRFLGLDPGTEYFWKIITVKPSNEGENYQTHITSGALVVGQKYKVIVDDAGNNADFTNIGGPGGVGVGVAANDVFTPTSSGIPTDYDGCELIIAGDVATSATWSFTTGGAVVKPTIAYPKDETTVYSPVPIFYWYTMGFNTIHEYEIEWSTTPGNLSNNTVDVGASAIVLSSTEGWKDGLQGLFGYPTPALEGGEHFYWHVRSYIPGDPTNHSDWSDTEEFYTFDAVNAAIPVPAYPTGGVEVYSKFPVLYWTLSGPSQGLTFNVQYGTNLSGVLNTDYWVINDIAQLYVTLYQGIVGGNTYFWQVQSDDGTGPSAWSDVAEFSVYDFTADLKPILSWPIGGNTVYTTDVNFAWHVEGPSLGLSYVLRYAETVGDLNLAGAVTGTGVETTSSSNLKTVTLTSGTDYVWAVRVNNTENASNWSDIETFTVISGNGSSIPVLNWPVGGATVWATSQDLSWTLVSGGSPTFTVEVYDDAALGIGDHIAGSPFAGVAGSPLNINGLTAGETYYWRVMVEPAEPWSNVEVFTVFAGLNPAAPLAGSPVGGVELTKNEATLSWFAPTYMDHSVKYEVEYADNIGLNNSTVVGNLESPRFQASGLTTGNYYWRSRSMNEDGTYSGYSNLANFQVTGVTGLNNEEGVPSRYELSQNYPNPFNPNTLIKFSLPEASYVTLKIYNMLGQEIRILVSEQANAGVYSVNWNGKDNFGHSIASGAYIYQIVAGNFVQTRKMILLK